MITGGMRPSPVAPTRPSGGAGWDPADPGLGARGGIRHPGSRVLGVRVLDLFAGSGALGLEALSRGADFATFVDSFRSAVAAITQNLEALAWQERARLIQSDCGLWLESGPAALAEAGMVSLDPPYNDPLLERVLVSLDRLCTPGTVVLAEHHRRSAIPPFGRLERYGQRAWGGKSRCRAARMGAGFVHCDDRSRGCCPGADPFEHRPSALLRICRSGASNPQKNGGAERAVT